MVLNLEASILGLLGGSWVVISRVISGVTILITHIKGPIVPLITTHEPPSNASRACLLEVRKTQTPENRRELLQTGRNLVLNMCDTRRGLSLPAVRSSGIPRTLSIGGI